RLVAPWALDESRTKNAAAATPAVCRNFRREESASPRARFFSLLGDTSPMIFAPKRVSHRMPMCGPERRAWVGNLSEGRKLHWAQRRGESNCIPPKVLCFDGVAVRSRVK